MSGPRILCFRLRHRTLRGFGDIAWHYSVDSGTHPGRPANLQSRPRRFVANAGCLPSRVSNPLRTDWQRHVLASSGYLELGMFDYAALVLEEIAPEDKTRNEVLGARVGIYMAARKWDLAAAVASHLVKVEPQTAGWWISLAYAVRRTESVEKAEAILLRAQAIHPEVAMTAFNLACYASVTGRMEEAKERLRQAIKLDKDIRGLARDDGDLKPLWDWIADLP
jgi:tetratricopeptide (TPR) repeat protein